jgi:K+-transporting ATPase ATPase B chain
MWHDECLKKWRRRNVPASELRRDDMVRVSAGEFIPADGEIIEGIAAIDESAITGESAPVIRESDSDHSSVTAGNKRYIEYSSHSYYLKSRRELFRPE